MSSFSFHIVNLASCVGLGMIDYIQLSFKPVLLHSEDYQKMWHVSQDRRPTLAWNTYQYKSLINMLDMFLTHICRFFPVVILTVWHVFIIICSNIFVVCEDGFYNSSCTDKCGRCLNGEACDKRNGTCLKGCQPHFAYPLCRGNFISHNLKQSRSWLNTLKPLR